jgi:hypothetical protein
MKPSLGVFVFAMVFLATDFTYSQTTPPPSYDTGNIFVLKGTVAGFAWARARTFIVVDVEGKNERWAVEGDGAAALAQRGWSSQTLKPSDKISVSALSLKQNGKPPEYLTTAPPSVANVVKSLRIAYGVDVTLEDGKKLIFGERGN